MQQNQSGIFASRPWKIHGEGPSLTVKPGEGMNEEKVPDLTSSDVRFTTRNGAVFSFVQGRPTGPLQIAALGLSSPQAPGRVISVRLVGSDKKAVFQQTSSSLKITLPEDLPPSADIGVALEVRFA